MPTLSQRLIAQQPYCVYCGGVELAVNIDHVPPRAIFDGKQRPKGLEVAACHQCHEGTRGMDAVISFVSRFYPDPTTEGQKADMVKATRNFVRRFPRLLEELGQGQPYRVANSQLGYGFNAKGPLLNSLMLTNAARLGFALHQSRTGRMVAAGDAAFVKWYANVQALEGRLPQDLLAVMGPSQTLQLGKWQVSEQFSYSTASLPDQTVTAYWASLRRSFYSLAFVSHANADQFGNAPSWQVFRPGFLPRVCRRNFWRKNACAHQMKCLHP